MTYCIVTSSKEFKDLESKATVNSDVLAAKIALWQQQNNTDRFPTLKELGVEERVSVKPGVQELFESNESLANAVYEALGFTGAISLKSNLKNTGKTEQELIEYLKKKYPEIKLNITNNPIWEQGDDVFNQELEEQINNFELFEDQDKLCPSGICNYTAKASTEHLQKIGLNPYPSNYNGSQLPVKVKSPIGDFDIEHYVSAVVVNNVVYIYDMPQNEFISNEFFGKGSDVKVKESYKPRLIPLTIDEIKANYNLSTKEAGNFIHSIINNKGWMGANAAPSFKEYIQNNIKNSEEYINLLEAQIKDSGYEFKEWDVEEYRKGIKDKRDTLKTKKVTKEEEQKVIKYYENKLKLKTKEYLPKKADKFSLKTLVDSVIGRGFDRSIDLSSFETALESLDKYLKSETFIEDLLNKVIIAEENLDLINKSIDQVYSLAKLFASFTKQVKVYGIEEAIKKYDSKQQYTIRTLLPSNVLDKYKSKEQAALLLQKYWGNKDNIVKQLNIFKTKTFTDLITNKFKAHSVFNKYQTVLNFLKSTDFNSSYLYQVISNEAIRKYTYFDKIGNTQFQKDEFNRIIGQANIKAMTVLVDAVNKKADTIPHEYAHHYIAWFRNTPIVQEGIKRFGSEEALVQAIGEQVVKQKGEAYNWWKKFTNFILRLLSDKQLLQVLTDSFLNRTDLSSDFTYNQITSQQKQQAQQLYSQYLDTIFPDSKVKDIVYHGSDRFIEYFDKAVNSERKFSIFFAHNKKTAKEHADLRTKGKGIVIPVILNALNPKKVKNVNNEFTINHFVYGEHDSLIQDAGYLGNEGDIVTVNKPEQIHILGNKQDIEGFKKFAQGKSRKTTLSKPEYKKADMDKATKFLQEKLGMTTDEIVRVNGLIENENFGRMLTDGKIVLSDLMEVGTEYHEAFHRVWSFYLSPEERTRLLEQFKSDPDYKSKIQYLTKSYPDLTEDDLIEEYFAEDFRDYNLAKPKPSNIFEKIYQDIINFFDKLFKASPKDIKELYKLIDEGKYSKAKKLVENTSVEKNRAISINSRELTATEKHELLSAMDYYFAKILFTPSVIKNFTKEFDGEFVNGIFDIAESNYTSDQIKNVYDVVINQILDDLEISNKIESNEILEAFNEDPDNAFVSLIKEHLSRLSSFNIKTLEEKTSDIITKPDKLSTETDNLTEDRTAEDLKEEGDKIGRSNLDIIPAIEFNTKDSMPKAIKLLISALPDRNKDYSLKRSNVLNIVQAGSWNNNVNILKNSLATLPADINIFIDKIKELSEKYPQFNDLLDYLNDINVDDIIDNNEPITDEVKTILDLRRSFVSEFALTKYNFYTGLLKNGNMVFIPANKENYISTLLNEAKVKFKKNYSEFTGFKLKGDKDANFLAMLKDPNVSLEEKFEVLGLGSLSDVSEEGLNIIKDEVSKILNLVKVDKVSKIYDGEYSVRLNKIINVIAESKSENTELQFMNIDGKPVYLINLNTYQTIIADTINYYIDLVNNDDSIDPIEKRDYRIEYLKEALPHIFKNNQSENSRWIQKIYNGEKVEYAIVEGLKDVTLDKATHVSDLKEGDLFSLNLNMTLSGLSPSQKHSDRSLFPVYKIGTNSSILTPETNINNVVSQAKDVITGYLIDELNKPKGDYSYMDRTLKDEKTYKVKSFFSEIIPYNDFKDLVKGTLQPTDKYIADKITNYLKQSVISEDVKMFKEYGLNKTYKKVEGFGEYADTIYEQTAIGISEELISKFNNDWELAVSYAALESFLQKYEQSILFVGDVTAYKESKDLPKRLNTQSSTGKLSLIGKEIDYQVRKLNSESPVKIGDTTYTYKKDYDVNIIRELVISDPAVKSYYYDNIKQAIKDKLLKDFKGKPLESKYKSYEDKAEEYATSYAKAYQEYTENDGFSYINMFMAREFEYRSDEWNDAKQRNFDLQVKFINSGYDLDSIKDDLNIPDDVKDIGEWLFKTYAPLTIKKPQYVGPNDFTTTDEVGLNVIAGRKTAYLPLMPTAIYDVALNAVHEFMIANSIDVLHMEGAAKFGIKQMRPLYTEGNWDLQEITEDQIGRLPWKYMKNQVKINNIPKNKITSSTQARKNILEGFFDKGVPSDFPGTKEEWDSLSEENKLKESDILKLVKKYEKVQNTIINRSIDNLLEELDAQVYPDEIKISVKKLRDVLVEAAKDRNSADNVIEAAEKFLEDVKYVELIPNSNKIEPILNALVTNRVLVQKRLGDMVPQAAVTGFESGPRQYDKDGTLKSDSDVLKFYEINKDGSISPAEIIIPVTPEILKAAFTKYNTRNILEAVQKLNSDIAKGDLEVIAKGLRIPNQQFSSNDVFKIKKFLLPMMQGMAVVPSELVAKTGGDFDIDKISLYYYHLDKDGNRIKYYETHTDELFDKFLEDKGVFKKQGDIKTDPNYKSFASRLDNLEAALNALGQEAINEFIKYANETTGKEATTSKEAKSNLREQQQNNQNTIDEIQKTLDASGRETRKQAVEEGVFLENFDNLVAQQKSLIGQNKLIQRQINDFYAPTQEEKDLEAKRKSAIKAIRTRSKNIKEAFREEFEATPVEEINSQKALENHFLDIEIQMLLHPSQAKNLYSPVADTPLASSKSTYVPKEGIPMTRLFTEAFNVKASIRFVSGKAGVGQLATWINLADLAQRYGVKLNPEYPAVQINIEGFTSNLDLGNNLDEVGESVSIVLSALLTSQVDLVKDPYAEILNIVNQTLDTISYMVLRGISIENIIHIMKHPYISEFLKEERINQSMIIKSTRSFKKGGFVKSNADLKNQFGVLDYEPSIITIDQIKSKDKSISKDVLALFLNLREQAKEVNKVKRYYSPDTKYLKDRNSVIALNDLYQEINAIPFPIITLDEQRKLISNDSIIEPFFKGRELYNDLYERFYFVDKLKVYQAFKTTLPKLLYLTTTDKEKFYNKLDQHLITYFIQNFYSVIENYNFDEIMKGKNSLAKGLFDLKDNPKFKDNLFLQNIFVLLENGSAKLDNFRSFKGKGTTSFINEQADSFEELPLEIQNLIEIGNIFQSGTYNSIFQLNKFLPYTSQSKIVSDINDVIDAILTDSEFRSEIINEFAHKFLLANTEYLPEDWKFNPKYNYSNITSFFPYAIDNNNKVHLVIDGSLTSQIVTPIGNYQGVDYRKQVPITDNFVESSLYKLEDEKTYVDNIKVLEGDIFKLKGIPVITTNLGGVHGAGLAQLAKSKGLIQKGDGNFKATNKVVQLPVKKVWSDSMYMNNNMQLLEKSLISLKDIALANPDNTYLLPLAGLGHGEGKVEDILPLLIETVSNTPNIKLVIPGEEVNLGRQGTVRKDSTKEKMPKIKQMLKESGLINEQINESGIFVPTEGLKKINPYATKPGVKPEVQDGTDEITIDNFDEFFPEYKEYSTDEKIQMLRAMSQEELKKLCKIR